MSSSQVTVVRCHEWGDPARVLRVEREEVGDPGPGQVRVRMRAAPVNPADLNVIEGRYGLLPPLPAYVGNEGAGVVQAVGPGVEGLSPGQMVRPVPGVGTWREELVCRPDKLQLLPDGLTTEQAAVLTVNPATAWRMLHDFVALQPGDWVLQNAGSSAVGRHVIQLCRHLGLHSISVVRRAEACAELTALGADLVLVGELELKQAVRALTSDSNRPRLALNAVGGQSALDLAAALAPGGVLVTYGAMGKEPVVIPNGPLIFKELTHRGFWVTAWYRRAGPRATREMFDALARLFAAGVLCTFIEQRFPLSEVASAVALARQPGRRGKALLTMGGD